MTDQERRVKVSIVVPVYNSEATLEKLVERLMATLAAKVEAFEIILVNDGSRDRSWPVIDSLADRFACVRGIDLSRNFGQHNALLAGIRAVTHEIIVTIDDDLQNPPEEIPRLIAPLAGGDVDVVYGVAAELQHEPWRNLASESLKFALQSFMGAETARSVSAFRAFRTRLRDSFADYRGSLVSIDVLLTWGTQRFASVAVRHEPRSVGQSNYTVTKLFTHALNLLTGFSTLPLRIASWIGFFFTVFGLLVFAYVVGRYMIQGAVVPGFAFLASVIAIFAGAQLFALGIIGEYLSRMYFRALDKPSYTIRGTRSGSLTAPATAGDDLSSVGG